MKPALAYAAKFATALVAAGGIAIAQGLIQGTAAKWAAIGIAFAGAVGVYVVPNTPATSMFPRAVPVNNSPPPGPTPAGPSTGGAVNG